MRIRFVLASSGLSVLAVVLAGNAYPDTRNSNQDRATMERKASPSTDGKQDEERAEAHSQPDTPYAGGTAPRNAKKAKPGKKATKESSSTGSSAPSSAAAIAERDRAFHALDIDGDGAISKAEAAGNAELITRFDRADRNRDGKLSRKEFEALARAGAPARASR